MLRQAQSFELAGISQSRWPTRRILTRACLPEIGVVEADRLLGDASAMTPNSRMEQLSLAYIRAVAADAGYQVHRPETDFDSVDGFLTSDVGGRARIDFQAKATTRDIVQAGSIRFPLPIKNYDDLRADTMVPRILIVLLMPECDDNWLAQTDEKLCLRRCTYWLSLAGMPPSSNASSVTVHIPVANAFDRTQLDDLMNNAASGRM